MSVIHLTCFSSGFCTGLHTWCVPSSFQTAINITIHIQFVSLRLLGKIGKKQQQQVMEHLCFFVLLDSLGTLISLVKPSDLTLTFFF